MWPYSLSASPKTSCASTSDTCLTFRTFFFPRAAPSSDREKTEAQGEARSVCHQAGLTEIWGQSWLGTQTRWFWDQNSISIFFCCWSSQWWTRCLRLMLQENKGFLITKACYKKTSHRFESQLHTWGCVSSCQELHPPQSTPFSKWGWCTSWSHRNVCICNLAHEKLCFTH